MNPFWLADEVPKAARAIGLTRMQWSYALLQRPYFLTARAVACAEHRVCGGHLLAVILGRN